MGREGGVQTAAGGPPESPHNAWATFCAVPVSTPLLSFSSTVYLHLNTVECG